jgi:hypothetical protein
MAELFQTTPQKVTMHLAAIFAEGELVEGATCKDFLQVRADGALFTDSAEQDALGGPKPYGRRSHRYLLQRPHGKWPLIRFGFDGSIPQGSGRADQTVPAGDDGID